MSLQLKATHIVGGEMIYNYLGENRYKIQLQFYVDCINGSPEAILSDTTASIAVFNSDTLVEQHYVYRNTPLRLNEANYTCISALGKVCVDMYVYDTILTLPPIKNGYDILYQRCCRNHTILNLINPGGTGSTYIAHVSGLETAVDSNSSPRFKNLPPNYLCLNELLYFDHSASDPDGDSLYYKLSTPYQGANATDPLPEIPFFPPLDSVRWNPPYNDSFQLPIKDSFYLNPHTGQMQFTPNRLGQYVFGIVVEEYRNGKKIGQTLRDYQFNVLRCDISIGADFYAPEPNCSTQVFFENESIKADSFYWDFGDGFSSSAKNPEHLFKDTGFHTVKLLAFDGNCKDSITKQIRVLTDGYHLKTKLINSCNSQKIQLAASYYTGATYQWHIDGDYTQINPHNVELDPSKMAQHWVKIKLANCHFIDSFVVTDISPKLDIKLSPIICSNKLELEISGPKIDNYNLDVTNANIDRTDASKPVISFLDTGFHYITINYYFKGCPDNFNQAIRFFNNGDSIKKKKLGICLGDSLSLKATQIDGASYSWNNILDGLSQISNFEYSGLSFQEGITTATIRIEDCIFYNKFITNIGKPKAEIKLSIDTHCLGNTVKLESVYNPKEQQITWYRNDSALSADSLVDKEFITNGTANKYVLVAKSENCYDSMETVVKSENSGAFQFEIPNVISPNNDGLNECFTVISNMDINCHDYEISIYNRWGELLFQDNTEQAAPCWPGTNQRTGNWVSTGTYFYILLVDQVQFHGTITVIR